MDKGKPEFEPIEKDEKTTKSIFAQVVEALQRKPHYSGLKVLLYLKDIVTYVLQNLSASWGNKSN
jgi:hypothetical protein